jgi:hypothetical protein
MIEGVRVTGLADSMFTKPFVDVDEWRDELVLHRYVHGGFERAGVLGRDVHVASRPITEPGAAGWDADRSDRLRLPP